MSQVARVFVVLNLLLAAGFMFAAATFVALNNDYKKQLDTEQKAHRADNDAAARKAAELDARISDLTARNSALTEQNGELTRGGKEKDTQIESLNGQIKQKDTQIADLTRTNGEHATAVQNLRGDVARLVEANTNLDKAQREAMDKQLVAEKALDDLRKEKLAADNTIADHEKTIAKQGNSIKEKDAMIEFAKQRGMVFDGFINMPAVTGAVVNADNSMKLVVANLGATQGVVRGASLDIVRGATYIGRFRVDTVSPNSCAGLIELVSPGQQVMVGDRVTNTLN